MKKNHIIDLLPDYLDNRLNKSQRDEVEAYLKTKEGSEFRSLFEAFDKEKEVVPSDTLETVFLEQLELEKQEASKVVSLENSIAKSTTNWTNTILKIAASITLLVGTYFFGKQQQSQLSSAQIAELTNETLAFKQTAMLSLMENKSASRRIQGVHYIEEFEQPDEAIVTALANRMLRDENTNVRAAAVEVLSNYTNSETVKDTFIEALKTEKDPGIQIIIIQTLGKISEKKAAKPMRALLDQEETQPFVKEQIESVLTTII